jgi:transcriptional regulator with XRE-family HTH domain
MNWPSLIKDIIGSGMTQAQIAERVGTGQSHISELYRGGRKQPGWALGDRLLALHRERCQKIEQAAA